MLKKALSLFSLRTLRDKGFGKSVMEHTILEEIDKFTSLHSWQKIGKQNWRDKVSCTFVPYNSFYISYLTLRNKSTDLNRDLSIAVVNSLWALLTGDKIEHGNKRVSKGHSIF